VKTSCAGKIWIFTVLVKQLNTFARNISYLSYDDQAAWEHRIVTAMFGTASIAKPKPVKITKAFNLMKLCGNTLMIVTTTSSTTSSLRYEQQGAVNTVARGSCISTAKVIYL
jgi:hypothetical protein